MSYCRWSSDNFRCDLYCYEDVSGGITTHVAGNRIVGDIPEVDPYPLLEDRASVPEKVLDRMTDGNYKKWIEQEKAQEEFLENCQREPIGLPYDGESFNDPDYESFLARLLYLRELGYKFPDSVIEEVKEDISNMRGKLRANKIPELLEKVELLNERRKLYWKATAELIDMAHARNVQARKEK